MPPKKGTKHIQRSNSFLLALLLISKFPRLQSLPQSRPRQHVNPDRTRHRNEKHPEKQLCTRQRKSLKNRKPDEQQHRPRRIDHRRRMDARKEVRQTDQSDHADEHRRQSSNDEKNSETVLNNCHLVSKCFPEKYLAIANIPTKFKIAYARAISTNISKRS